MKRKSHLLWDGLAHRACLPAALVLLAALALGPQPAEAAVTEAWVHRYNNVASNANGYSSNGTNGDYYTVKYAAADGALLWEKRYNGPANNFDVANSVAVDGSGNAVVTGTSYNGETGIADY